MEYSTDVRLEPVPEIETSTHACGGGDWSIEVRDNKGLLFELVGSNGSRNGEVADDLWADLAELESQV